MPKFVDLSFENARRDLIGELKGLHLPAFCIRNCNCSDKHRCAPGCFWEFVDRDRRLGVCRNCATKDIQ